jgi:hypothetical protein
MDDRGKTPIVIVLAIAVCIRIAGYVAYDWWQKQGASASSPVIGGPNAPHGTVRIDYKEG